MKRHSSRRKRRQWSIDDCIFSFLSIWTVTQLTMVVLEFLSPIIGHYIQVKVPGYMPFSYFLLLSLYVVRKEVKKRLKRARVKRKGEIYLKLWWVVLFLLYIVEAFSGGYLQVPWKAVETVLLISTVYYSSEIHRYFLKKAANK